MGLKGSVVDVEWFGEKLDHKCLLIFVNVLIKVFILSSDAEKLVEEGELDLKGSAVDVEWFVEKSGYNCKDKIVYLFLFRKKKKFIKLVKIQPKILCLKVCI